MTEQSLKVSARAGARVAPGKGIARSDSQSIVIKFPHLSWDSSLYLSMIKIPGQGVKLIGSPGILLIMVCAEYRLRYFGAVLRLGKFFRHPGPTKLSDY